MKKTDLDDLDYKVEIYVAGCWHVGDAKGLKDQIMKKIPETIVKTATDFGIEHGKETHKLLAKADIVITYDCGYVAWDAIRQYEKMGGHVFYTEDCGKRYSSREIKLDDVEKSTTQLKQLEDLIRMVQGYKLKDYMKAVKQ